MAYRRTEGGSGLLRKQKSLSSLLSKDKPAISKAKGTESEHAVVGIRVRPFTEAELKDPRNKKITYLLLAHTIAGRYQRRRFTIT